MSPLIFEALNFTLLTWVNILGKTAPHPHMKLKMDKLTKSGGQIFTDILALNQLLVTSFFGFTP